MTRPAEVLDAHRSVIRDLVRRYRATNPRVFGSVLHGRDDAGSDLDILVDPLPDTTLFDLGGLHLALEDELGITVDLLTPGELPEGFRDEVLAEAQAI